MTEICIWFYSAPAGGWGVGWMGASTLGLGWDCELVLIWVVGWQVGSQIGRLDGSR